MILNGEIVVVDGDVSLIEDIDGNSSLIQVVDGDVSLELIDGECRLFDIIDGSCDLSQVIDGEVLQVVKVISGETYKGSYTITPSKQTQILQTSGLSMTDNVTINPIPSNYGLITYNGSIITVS